MAEDLPDQRTAERAERRRIVELLAFEGLYTGVMVHIVTGVLLVKFALELGAGPFIIGLLAAIPFLAQFMQIPAVFTLAAIQRKKAVVIAGAAIYRLALAVMVFIPLIHDKSVAIKILIITVLVRELGLGWKAGAWYSWVSALVPERFASQARNNRLRLYTMGGTCAALGAGLALDGMGMLNDRWLLPLFSLVFFFAFAAGMGSFMSLTELPERLLPKQKPLDMVRDITDPFKDKNFRKLMVFMFALLFAVNLAVPFFPYYMLTSLKISASYIIALWALTQFMQVPFFRWWGWVGDRFNYLTALASSIPFFLLGLILWPFVALPNVHMMTGPLLIIIHMLMGIGLAGVTLATQVIAMKMAPRKEATGYVTSMSLVAALASGTGALFGGAIAMFLVPYSLRVKLEWRETIDTATNINEVVPYTVTGFEFLFLFSALLILIASPLLRFVDIKGLKTPKGVVFKMMGERASSMLRGSVAGPGVRGLVFAPVGMLLRKK
tara:strand:- start:69749 stop:71233 length:1485 start_codon:yes stop_codon:yes gene_type:complete